MFGDICQMNTKQGLSHGGDEPNPNARWSRYELAKMFPVCIFHYRIFYISKYSDRDGW
jgi:hypothetical protein